MSYVDQKMFHMCTKKVHCLLIKIRHVLKKENRLILTKKQKEKQKTQTIPKNQKETKENHKYNKGIKKRKLIKQSITKEKGNPKENVWKKQRNQRKM